jgi:hypothetical protein
MRHQLSKIGARVKKGWLALLFWRSDPARLYYADKDKNFQTKTLNLGLKNIRQP